MNASSALEATLRDSRVPAVGARRTRLLSAVFYGGLILLMALILTKVLADILPAQLARRIGFNSEGYTLAIVLGGWIQFVLPRLTGVSRWAITLSAASGCAALGLVLYTGHAPSQFKTLNEAFFALAVILPYVTLARPLRRWPPLISAVLLITVVVGVATSSASSPVVLLAESFVAVMLAPLTFDVVDRGILDPGAGTSAPLRWLWYATLIAVPVVVVLLGTEDRTGPGFGEVLQYIGRVHEAVIGILLVQLFFAVGLGLVGSRAPLDRTTTGA